MPRPLPIRALDLAPLALAAWLLARLGSTWAARIPYPYDLEWMEGGMLAHAWRVANGLPLYVEPGPDFIPFIYPPGYASLIAAVGSVAGIDYAPARSLSLLGVLAASAAIVYGARRLGGSIVVGLLGAAVFLGCYPYSGAFYDLVRLDGVYVGLLAWAIVLGTQRWRGALEASALLLAAAFLFKQHVALFGLPMMIGIGRRDGRGAALRFALWSAAPALLVTGAVEIASGGRYLDYLLRVAGSHPMVGQRIVPGTPRELGWALQASLVGLTAYTLSRARGWLPGRSDLARFGAPIGLGGIAAAVDRLVGPVRGLGHVDAPSSAIGVFCVVALAVVLGWSAARHLRDRSWAWTYGVGVCGIALVTTAIMRGHHGGFLNVSIQLHWVTAFAVAVALARWRAHAPTAPVFGLTAAVFAAQLGVHGLALDERSLVPTAEDRAAGDAIVATLREFDGPVLSPFAPWLPVRAGFEPGLHLIALWDVNHPRSPFPHVEARMTEAVAARHWGAIVDGPRTFGFGVEQSYRVARRVQPAGRAFLPKTGWRTRPKVILVPRELPQEHP